MFNEIKLESFFNSRNYDVRHSRNARWIDQKCTPDVVCVVADCIVNYVENNNYISFSTKDIWDFEYAQEISFLFSKPNIHSESAKNEYDKFFQQPMELLAYSGVLSKSKQGNRNIYYVNDLSMLQYISVREKNSLNFLINYIKKVLKDSNLLQPFENFFHNPVTQEFSILKEKFENFTMTYTAISQPTECRRIFTKILNPLAFAYHSFGTERGRLSNHKISYDLLMYNRVNFRDLYTNKPKDITRNEYQPTIDEKTKIEQFWKYNSRKSKRLLRQFNDEYYHSKSEHNDELNNAEAIHMHHIFPEVRYPSISGHIENLIALTPSQHLTRAHPLGNTQEINKDYQYLLLISKTSKIEENLTQQEDPIIYDFEKFKEVLAVGLDNLNIYDVAMMDFSEIGRNINLHYM